MIKILIVDDNVDFLKSCEGFEFDKATVYLESQPVEALKKMKLLKPNIVVTDVMMPGVDGLSFATIVQSILSSVEIIVISANSKKQIEAEYGQLNLGTSFFKKPLGEDFFGHVDLQISERFEQLSNTDQDYEKMDKKLENTSALIKAYHAWQKCCFDIYTYKGSDIDDYTWENWKVAEGKFKTAVEIMEPGNNIRLLIQSLETQHGSWAKQVEREIELPEPLELKFAFKPRWLDSDIGVTSFQSVKVQEKSDQFVLVIDGKEHNFATRSDDYTPLMKKMTTYLKCVATFNELQGLFRRDMSEIYSAVIGKSQKVDTTFNYDPPLHVSCINTLKPDGNHHIEDLKELFVRIDRIDRSYEWLSERGIKGQSSWLDVLELPKSWTIIGIQEIKIEINDNYEAKVFLRGELIPSIRDSFTERLAEKADVYKVLQHTIEFANHLAQNQSRYWHGGIGFDIDSKYQKLDLSPQSFFRKILNG